MLELFQTEWCPGSRRIRQRLTELGLDYLNHQVPVEREQRTLLFGLTGSDTVPTLLLEDGSALVGEEAILAYLERHYDESEPPDAAPVCRGRRARPSRAQGGGVRGAVRDRRASDVAGEARSRGRAVLDPGCM